MIEKLCRVASHRQRSRPDNKVDVKLTMSDDLKYLVRKASVENIK